MVQRLGFAALTASLLLAGSASVYAHEAPGDKPAEQRPAILEGVGIDEKLGQKIDLALPFHDETGAAVTLGQYFDGKTPVILSPVYFNCPRLCNFHLNGLTEALKGVDWSAGTKFRVLAVSFDWKETSEVAGLKKANYMKMYDRSGTEGGWSFLTGDETSVKALMGSVGFKYRWNEEEKEWAHASSAIVISPSGVITRYLPGIMFEPKDVRLAITEAGEGKIGSFVDQLVLYCFHYDPTQSRYTVAAVNLMKGGGLLVILALGLWLLPFWFRSRRRGEEARSA